MAQEQMALYKQHGTNPLSACLPLLIQVPFFLAVFQVLSGITGAARQDQGIGAMSHEQVVQFDEASIFGAPLSASVLHGTAGDPAAVAVLTVLMILVMTASQFLTQRLMMARSMPEEAAANPFLRQQKMILYVLPFIFAVGGVLFPIGVLIYWTTSNLWTLAQQSVVK
jgi:YidC/Oxa1 family membrane protein insertase